MYSQAHVVAAEQLADELSALLRPEDVERLRGLFAGRSLGYAEGLLRELHWDAQMLLSGSKLREPAAVLSYWPDAADRLPILWAGIVLARRAADLFRVYGNQTEAPSETPAEDIPLAAYVAHEASAPETLWPFSLPEPWRAAPD